MKLIIRGRNEKERVLIELCLLISGVQNCCSSVSTETRLRAGRPQLNSRLLQLQIFSLRHRVQTGAVANSASYPIGTGGVKLTIHLHKLAMLIIRRAIPPLLQYVFKASYLVKRRDNFKFYIWASVRHGSMLSSRLLSRVTLWQDRFVRWERKGTACLDK
jgi:hypothetical protein